MDKVLGVKLSTGSNVDPNTKQEFVWDNVVLYLEHEDIPSDDQYNTYYGHTIDTLKFPRNKVKINDDVDWRDLVGCHIRLNYSVFNGKPSLQSIDVAC